MTNQTMYDLGNQPSLIRELFAYDFAELEQVLQAVNAGLSASESEVGGTRGLTHRVTLS